VFGHLGLALVRKNGRNPSTSSLSIAQLFTMFLLILVLAINAHSQTPTTAVQADFFGDHLINSTDWFTVSTGSLGKGTAVKWSYIQPTCTSPCSSFNWTNLDAWVNLAQSHNMKLLYSPEAVPQWAAADINTCSPNATGTSECSSTVTNLSDWDNFVTALVNRYKGKMIWELWNEPNTYFTGTYAQLVTLTQHFHDIVRANDPGAIIVSPSYTCSSAEFAEYAGCVSTLDGFWSRGGTRDVDAVSLHAYPHHANEIPESVVTTIGTYQTIMARYGVSKPLWDTEASWGDSSYNICCQNASADQQSGFLARHYLLHWSSGATRYYWYAWDNSGWGTLWDPSSGTHPAGNAYQQVYNWMVGATMPSPCAIAGSVWTCALTRPNGYRALVVWNPTGNSTYLPVSQYTQYRDLAGNTTAVSGSVTIGIKPILLESAATTQPNPPTSLTLVVR
jgi:Glycosyl hydrolase family 10